MGYPAKRKAAVLQKMLPPNNKPIAQLTAEEGIAQGTLYHWRGSETLETADPLAILNHSFALSQPQGPSSNIDNSRQKDPEARLRIIMRPHETMITQSTPLTT